MDDWHIDATGWLQCDLPGFRRVASPNFDARPAEQRIDLLVIHAISLPPEQFGGPGVEQLFTNCLNLTEHPYYAEIEGMKVSAHFFIRRDGNLIQFVSCLDRAWHAGLSAWQGRERCNDYAIGVELEGSNTQPFMAAQYNVLARLVTALQARYPLVAIVGHADIAPGRKTDPGPHFDWKRVPSL